MFCSVYLLILFRGEAQSRRLGGDGRRIDCIRSCACCGSRRAWTRHPFRGGMTACRSPSRASWFEAAQYCSRERRDGIHGRCSSTTEEHSCSSSRPFSPLHVAFRHADAGQSVLVKFTSRASRTSRSGETMIRIVEARGKFLPQ